ncbi:MULTISPECIES: flagellar hook-basal body complex protein FliE [unclassified Ensifer]|uniref:flagellar hook-basal body complex protein FliE n=1 Tax=unclassified Ensifer TaxID=2633371 RepID=UPI0008134F11|nr:MULTISPECIES: flagellar hook-basal body complex protein FliE [unclassified Ensifer]OCP04943.1 flagellar hook-basal body protein FliE [Ensifer sp. LC14]OCP11898.1 flagellar hook-basal body protein FliE [Ensifer sp. LC13]OCP12454.1 flagellar hook-basal body protein FliE [Ensifer sp. LC11]OCP33578.1 flagellar hook-basal body protein FliE [Ensifer sp. LC499]
MIDAVKSLGAFSVTKGADGINATSSSLSAFGLPAATQGVPQTQSFASVLGDMASDAVSAMKKAEGASIDGIRGQANTREVVDAVMSAEQSLQTAIAIRDKVVSAYLEIARMQI